MNDLHSLDDRLLLDVNTFARDTGWLHGAVAAYANYGIVLFALLLLAGLVVARRGSPARSRPPVGRRSPCWWRSG